MRIGIITDETDTGDLRSPQTPKQLVGFGYYTLNLVRHILLQDKKNEYYLIHRKKESHDIYGMAKEIIIPYTPRFPFSTVRNFITLPLKLRKYNLDVTHHLTSTGPFAFKPLVKGKAVETIHEIMPLLYPQCFELPVRLVFRFLLPRVAKNADYIFTACSNSRAELGRRFGIPLDRIGIIYPGTDPIFKPLDRKKCRERIRKKFGIKGSYILFVSTLEAKKNVPTLLKAYRELKERGCKHKLVLIGRKGYGYGKIESAMKELETESRTESSIITPGYVPLEDLPAFYNAADVFAFPAVDSGNMTVVDAMKCGCPVVVSNGGGGPEVVGDAGIKVGVYDSKGYADAIEKVIENKKLAGTMRRKGLQQAKKFSWEKSAKQTIEAYERLGSGKNKP